MRIARSAFLALIGLYLVGCQTSPQTGVAPAASVRTVNFKGSTYTVQVARDPWHVSSEHDADETESTRSSSTVAMPPGAAMPATATVAAAAARSACTAKPHQSDGRTFNGSAREIPKTTLPDAPIEFFPTVSELRKDVRANSDDFDMMDVLSTRCDERRVDAENRMVMVTGYLYAAKKEDDNDYHLILGTKNCKNPDCFMTAEVSGVPRLPKDRNRLATARDEFEEQIANFTSSGGMPSESSYLKFSPPVPVRVTGPLFYDADHKINKRTRAGAVGPDFARPSTSWEIHPVVKIEIAPTINGQPIPIAALP